MFTQQRGPPPANKHLAVDVIDLDFARTHHPLLPQFIRTVYLRWKMDMMDIVSTAHFEILETIYIYMHLQLHLDIFFTTSIGATELCVSFCRIQLVESHPRHRSYWFSAYPLVNDPNPVGYPIINGL